MRRAFPFLALAAAGALLLPLGREMTAQTLARRAPENAVLAAAALLGLYGLKSLSIALPMSALAAAGGLLFPLPLALGVNLAGAAVAQTLPWLLGRREQGGLAALAARHPRLAWLCRPPPAARWRYVFLLRLGGVSPGDLVSAYLGAAGVPWGAYLSAGLLGAAPRVAAVTVLGGALTTPESPAFWLSLATGGGLSALSLLLGLRWRRTLEGA